MTKKRKLRWGIGIGLAMLVILGIALMTGNHKRVSKEDARIFISPSTQSGNVYADGTTTEQGNMYAIADQVVELLEEAGCHVYMSDADCTLEEAVEKSNKKHADLHVAIHSNAVGDGVTVVRGCEVYAPAGDRQAAALAEKVYDRVADVTPGKDRGVKETDSLYELNHTRATGILIETDFHDNLEGANWLTTHRAELAQAIADGILDYLK